MARNFATEVVVADLDLPFGTASLDYNVEVAQGIGDAVDSGQRLDELLLDRLVTRCGERLGSLVAPGALDRSYDLGENAFDRLIEVAQMSVPMLVLDVPHAWNAWTRRVLTSADDVIVTMSPELAQLKNAKNLVDFLREARPNDGAPRLVLNQLGIPKRPEIRISDITAALDLEPIARIPFDPATFGTAANKGQMIAEVAGSSAVTAAFVEIAHVICGRASRPQRRAFDLGSLRQKLSLRRSGPESSRAA
jgi:pilus assembly protein CpaE